MSKQILIVDDDPDMLRLLTRCLREAGYEPIEASDGQQALKLVLERATRIVITDRSMPEMDGLQLSRALREHEGVRFVYIIMVTGYADVEDLVEAFDAGIDDFIAKPVNRQELLARIRSGERICALEADLARRTLEIHRLNAEMAMTNERLQRLATTDELTGLLNRREALVRLKELWAVNERYKVPFSCIMLDVDHFKKINDAYGHATGDVVLRSIARLLKSSVRASDLVCRMGGEEFLILCPGVGVEGAEACAEKLRNAVEQNVFGTDAVKLRVTISAGVSQRVPAILDSDEVLREADEALYLSKQTGRNRVTLSPRSLPDSPSRAAPLSLPARRAIEPPATQPHTDERATPLC